MKFEINSPLTTIKNSQEFIKQLLNTEDSIIEIYINNSFSFPSSIIAVLEKLKEEKEIKIFIKNEELYNLFEDLNLTSSFKVYKI
jgi:hypothetical protein